MQLTPKHLDLIKKIINARLSVAELKEVTEKTAAVLCRKPNRKLN